MKLSKLLFFVLILLLIMSCGGGASTSTATLTSIAVTPANPIIASGATQQFTATGTYSDNTTRDITTSVTWNSDTTAVAAIDSTGLATAVTTGNTTIKASSGSISGSTTLTVTPATITSLEITPANPGMLSGTTKQLTATGTYSNGTTQDLTTSVTWSSFDTTVATISSTAGSNGLVTSSLAGTTTITALLGSISDSTLLTVQNDNNDNMLTVTVNGGVGGIYKNGPFVSVTVCSPGTSNCQIINNILLDTGASGLRIFKSLLTVSLTQVASGSGSLTECIQYSDNSADWGPVQLADIILGNEPAVRVPIQIIDSTFSGYNSCSLNGQYILDTSPSITGYNGILGVGLFTEDCGSECTSVANNGMYYSCNGSSCTGTEVSLNNQVQNPVSLLLLDNNGVIVQLPSIPLGGLLSVKGILILGIGTRSNNIPSGVTMYPADPNSANLTYGDFTTVFNGKTYSDSFIDSGSNGLFFDQGSISALTTCDSDWFCASPTLSLSATTKGYTGSPSGTVSFQIGDADTLLYQTSNNVFIELGGPDTSFDWGLPFFLGRSVYVGIDGQTSSLGTGPYWAY
jgi:hypothetical protein